MSRPDDIDSLSPGLEDALARPTAGPDLTRSIMGRLGYMRASRTAVRRGHFRRWATRVTTCLFGMAVLAVGLRVHDQGSNARRPAGPTVHSAIGNQVSEHQERLIQTLETIREIAPAVPATIEGAPPQRRLDVDLEGSAAGPIC